MSFLRSFRKTWTYVPSLVCKASRYVVWGCNLLASLTIAVHTGAWQTVFSSIIYCFTQPCMLCVVLCTACAVYFACNYYRGYTMLQCMCVRTYVRIKEMLVFYAGEIYSLSRQTARRQKEEIHGGSEWGDFFHCEYCMLAVDFVYYPVIWLWWSNKRSSIMCINSALELVS